MGLLLAHPNLPSCHDCKRWMYSKTWQREMRAGQPIPRRPGDKTPCWSCPKIPRGAEPKPENAVVLTPKNHRAYWYFLQCRVDPLGQLPRDEITIRNNALIQLAIDQHERARSEATQQLLVSLGVRFR